MTVAGSVPGGNVDSEASSEDLDLHVLNSKADLRRACAEGDPDEIYLCLGKLLKLPPWREMFNERRKRLKNEKTAKAIGRVFLHVARDNAHDVAEAESDLVEQFRRIGLLTVLSVPEELFAEAHRAFGRGQDRRTTKRRDARG